MQTEEFQSEPKVMSLPRRKTMFPIMESIAKFGTTHFTSNATAESIADSLEYIYVDDPKDGNDSSADESKVKPNMCANERNSAYTSRQLVESKNDHVLQRIESAKSLNALIVNGKEETVKSSDEDEAYFSLPWRLLPAKVLEDLEFYKNAGKLLNYFESQQLLILIFSKQDASYILTPVMLNIVMYFLHSFHIIILSTCSIPVVSI